MEPYRIEKDRIIEGTAQSTPKSLRLHIGLFGRQNVGKSSLLNTITRQNVSIVSEVAGTTTDPVEKPMEFLPLGPVFFIDTAGIDDKGALGQPSKLLQFQGEGSWIFVRHCWTPPLQNSLITRPFWVISWGRVRWHSLSFPSIKKRRKAASSFRRSRRSGISSIMMRIVSL
jgi:hypothetical protein